MNVLGRKFTKLTTN